MKRLIISVIVLVLATSVGCERSQKKSDQAPGQEAAPMPQKAAPAEAEADESAPAPEESSLRGKKELAESADEGAACPDDACRDACAAYSGEQVTACAEAYKAGCFDNDAPDDFDCGSFGSETAGGVKEIGAPPARERRRRSAPPSDPKKSADEAIEDKATPTFD